MECRHANREIGHRRRERQDEPRGLRVHDCAPDAPQIDVVQEQGEQTHGQHEHDNGSEGRSHLELSAFYYTAPTCCCCQARCRPCKIAGSAPRGNLLPLATPLLHTSLRERPPDRQGKVRDLYDFGDHLLIVATDRLSAFDYILGSGIPDKGKVLTQISAFWFDRTRAIVPNHVVSTDPAESAKPRSQRSAA